MNLLLRASCAILSLTSMAALHASELNATMVDNSGKPLPDAVVYLATKQPLTAAANVTATVDQVDREFVPRVSVVQTGTSIHFPNRDNIRHQVYSFSPPKVFQLKLYSGTPSAPILIDKSGVIVLGCNIHDHMVAWILSVATPWFGQANGAGRAIVAGVPAGRYELLAWYPGVAEPLSLGDVQFDGKNKLERSVTLQVGALPAVAAGS
jgi:plastocyanin